MEAKNTIRRTMLGKRDGLSGEYRTRASDIIADKLLRADWYGECEKILVYAAIRSEVNLDSFIETAWKDKKKLYFPRVEGAEMEFYRADCWEELSLGAFGVREPAKGERLDRMLPFLTPMLVPGVAFSGDGYRIGYGKGFYDKYLTANQKNKRLRAIGIAYSMQLAGDFMPDACDYPVQEVITEE